MAMRERFRGALLGLAAGDAVGTTLEFQAPGSFQPLTDMVGALRGESKEALLAPVYSPVPGLWEERPLVAEIEAIAEGAFKHKQPPAIQGTGYVVRSLEAALWAFHRSESFEEGCLMAANLGNDADTTAAVYGQLAGAYYGEAGIPARWRERLAMRETIGGFADDLYDLAHAATSC